MRGNRERATSYFATVVLRWLGLVFGGTALGLYWYGTELWVVPAISGVCVATTLVGIWFDMKWHERAIGTGMRIAAKS